MNHKPLNIKGLSQEILGSRLFAMKNCRDEIKKNVNEYHVYISKGNSKTGELVPSVSLIPVEHCPNSESCKKLCYDVRNDCVYPSVRAKRAVNAAIYECDQDRYFSEISKACQGFRFFRWHVGGDIVNYKYLLGMVRVAEDNPHCRFLAFTKNFNAVNEYLVENELPENLQIVFSCWPGLKVPNPNNLPTSHPLFANGVTTAHYGAKYCTGNCSLCAIDKNGCFDLKRGEEVIFLAH